MRLNYKNKILTVLWNDPAPLAKSSIYISILKRLFVTWFSFIDFVLLLILIACRRSYFLFYHFLPNNSNPNVGNLIPMFFTDSFCGALLLLFL